MANNIFRGDAVAVAQVVTVTPGTVEVGDVFTLTINGKTVSYTALLATVADVTAGLVAAVNASPISEFAEIVAADLATALTLTARTAGQPFRLAVSTTNSAAGNVTIAETTPGVEAVDEVQKVELQGTYTGGTFTLTVDLGIGDETTGTIAYNASAATVRAALEGLPSGSAGDFVVTGGPGPSSPWFVQFTGTYAATNVNPIEVNGGSLTGNGDVTVTTTTQGGGLSNEIQSIYMPDNSSGTYKLGFNGQWTGNLAAASDAATVATALAGLSTIGSGNVRVDGGDTTVDGVTVFLFFVTFQGDLAGTNVALLDTDQALLGGAGAFAVNVVQSGGQSAADEFQIVFLGGATGGTFKLTYAGQTTADLSYRAGHTFDSAAFGTSLKNALEALSNITAGDIQVHGVSSNGLISGVYLVQFGGTLADTDVSQLVLNSAALTGTTETPAVDTVHAGGANTNEVQAVRVFGTGGTFTLSDGTDTTSAITFGAAAGTIDTRLESDITAITAVTVTGTGTPADPYVVTFTDPGSEDVVELTGDGSSLTGGDGESTTVTDAVSAVNEVQTITIGVGVTSGTWAATFRGETATAIAYGATAGAVETALETLSTIDGVSVAGSAGGPWAVTFDVAPLAGSALELLGVDGANLVGGSGTETITASETTRSAGSNHWDDAGNWTTGRVPDSTDAAIVASGKTQIRHGLRQRATCTADAGTDQVTADVDFVDDQIVRVTSTGTLPAGLSAATDYYVINLDRAAAPAGTVLLQLSLTSGGAAVNITDAGTGTHTIAVELDSIEVAARYTGRLGLPQRSASEYWEYRPGYLAIGLAAAGSKTIAIGKGDGSGSGLIKLDLGAFQFDASVYETGGSSDPGLPACLLLGSHASNTLLVLAGEVGVAALAAETSTISLITQRGGSLDLGEVTLAAYERTGGELRADGVTLAGSLLIAAG